MDEKGTMARGNPIIIGELRKNFLFLSLRAGRVCRVNMHIPVSQRARLFTKFFREEVIHHP